MSETFTYLAYCWSRADALSEGDRAAREWFGDGVEFTRTEIAAEGDDSTDHYTQRVVITYRAGAE